MTQAVAPARTDRPDVTEIVEIGEGFLARTFPAERFHHREHLIMIAYLLVRYPARDWPADLPGMIRGYNVSQGGVNDAQRGYHHTITMAFLHLVRQILQQGGGGDPATACAAVLRSPAAKQDVLLRFYSRERLYSIEARLGWLDPDLTEIALA